MKKSEDRFPVPPARPDPARAAARSRSCARRFGHTVKRLRLRLGCMSENLPSAPKKRPAMPGAGRPKGSITIAECWYCSHFTLFDDDLKRRELTMAELQQITADPDIIRMQRER